MKNLLLNNKMMILGGLVLSSFLLRLFNAVPKALYPDSCLYLSFAKSILKGKFSFDFQDGIESISPPLYAVSNAILSFLTGDMELAGILVSAVAGALLIIPVFYLARAIYNERAAWICVAFIFFNPVLIHWSGAILTESLFITLFLSGIAFGWYGIEKRSRVLFLLSGVFIGLSYMTRIIGLVAIPVLVLCIILYSVMSWIAGRSNPGGSDHFNLKRLLRDISTFVIIFLVGFIMITGVYLVKLHSFYGQWTLSGPYGSIKGTIAYEGSATAAGYERLETRKSEESIIAKVSKKVMINAQNYLSMLFKMLSLTIIFVIAGLFRNRKVIYVASFVFFYFAALLLQPLSPLADEKIRYLSPMMPLLLITASGGVVHIHDLVKQKVFRQAIIPIGVGIILLSSIPQLGVFPVHFNKSWFKKESSIDVREKVGLWMKENLPHPIRVMSRKPYMAYYADAIWFGTPATYEEVIQLANSKGVDYIILDRGIDFQKRPELRFLFYPKQAPENLQFIGGIKLPGTGELYIVIYKIRRSD